MQQLVGDALRIDTVFAAVQTPLHRGNPCFVDGRQGSQGLFCCSQAARGAGELDIGTRASVAGGLVCRRIASGRAGAGRYTHRFRIHACDLAGHHAVSR
jgi:hypothetical protein